LVASSPQWIVAKKDFPATDLKEMVDWLKANPGKATAASYGIGSTPPICELYLENRIRVQRPQRDDLQTLPIRN